MPNSCRIIKKKRGKKVLYITLVVLAAIVFVISVFIKSNVTPMILALSEERVRSLTSDAVSQAVIDVMSQNNDIDYLKITRDEKQNIKSVSFNGAAVTKLAEQMALTAQKYITDVGSDGIKIPLGSLSGFAPFTGLGPDINMRVYLVGSTHSELTSSFTSAGVNQTLHRLFFTIHGNIAVAVPGIPSTVKVSAQVLMGETLIAGEVPPTYLHSTSVGDMLDLAA